MRWVIILTMREVWHSPVVNSRPRKDVAGDPSIRNRYSDSAFVNLRY
jgi:hypothetical protein